MEASSRSEDVVVNEESKKDRSSDGDELFEREGLVKIGNGKKSHDSNDKKSHSNNQGSRSSNQVPFVTKMEKSSVELDSMTSSSSRNDQDEELESARAEMGEVREENERLKMCLDQIMKNYRTLQMQFDDIVRQDGKKNMMPPAETRQEVEETDLVSLTLGRFPSVGKTINEHITNSHKLIKENDQQIITQELALGLDFKVDGSRLSDRIKAHSPKGRSPSSNSNEEVKDGEGEDPWPPNKGLKTMRSGEDEVMQQNPPKKARVCVRARCDTPTMNDGCQWRKYGQKIAKGNPCPRAYYRCTGAQSCPVRKQVQRCAEDMSILITTYEGTHNHPLSVSATAMASTTSAAAAMLLSGSSSSQSSANPSATTATTTTANLHGLNFYLSDNLNSKQFYLPNSSISSSSPTNPTITIDLTSNSSASSSASASSHFGRPFSSSYPPRFPLTNLDFGSSQFNLMSWGNGVLGYGNQLPYNRTQMGTLDIGGLALQNGIHQTYIQKTNNVPAAAAPPRQPLPDPIAAATKAITADPSFQSALAAALTSFIGNGASSSGGGENFLEKLKWVEKFPLGSSTQKGNGCGSSFMNTTPATNSQRGNLTFLPSNSSPFSTSKSSSTSPGDNRDHQPS